MKLTGFVANPYAYMARASVFAVSSLWEGASNVVIEALATGTPVVAYRCPTGIAEVVAREALVATGDVEGLARAILMQISQPRQAEVFKAQAARYSLAASLEAYIDLFRKTLAAPPV